MTEQAPEQVAAPVFTPAWLDPADVTTWLTSTGPSGYPADQVNRVCGQTELYVQRCRPDQYVPDSDPPVYLPDAEVYQGAVMYAGRELRRRNSPTGSETFADGGASFVSKYDSDIERALRTGAWTIPGVG